MPRAQDAPAEEPAVKVDAEKDGEGGEEKEAGEADDAEDAEEDEEPKFEVVVATAPHDPRFPSTNQARHCYTRYNEFYRCGSRRLCGGCWTGRRCVRAGTCCRAVVCLKVSADSCHIPVRGAHGRAHLTLLIAPPRCKSQKGEEDPQCEFYKKAYRSLCPNDWVRCTGHPAPLAVTRCVGRAYLCRRVPVRKRFSGSVKQEALRTGVGSLAQQGCLPRASAAHRTLAAPAVGSLCLQIASPPPFAISADMALVHELSP